MEITLFCDTYALIELFNGNPHFIELRGRKFAITYLNLMEFYYHSLVEKGPDQAQAWHAQLKENVVQIENRALFESMAFRSANKKLKLSYTDAVGYIVAKQMGISFVTGDESFKDLDNVLFLKK